MLDAVKDTFYYPQLINIINVKPGAFLKPL